MQTALQDLRKRVKQLAAEARGLPVLRDANRALADEVTTWKANHNAVAAQHAALHARIGPLEHQVAALQGASRDNTAALAAARDECAELRKQVSQLIVEKAAQTKVGLAPSASAAGSGGSGARPPLPPGARM
jgi:predicted  nucleic acid-binding Zn-ribbon protein